MVHKTIFFGNHLIMKRKKIYCVLKSYISFRLGKELEYEKKKFIENVNDKEKKNILNLSYLN